MAFSGSISGTTFNALKVVDHAFRRCRLPAQAITSEMQTYALESLYLALSDMSNVRTPSWCIDKLIFPLYQNQPIVELPIGTVEVLNLNYRTIQILEGDTTITATSHTTLFEYSTQVSTVGVKWAANSVPLTFEVSSDGIFWTQVGSQDATAVAGEITWTDISAPMAYMFFRITSAQPIFFYEITLGNLPQEIPMGALNRDGYVAQSNKIFPGRPSNYWFQRDIKKPRINLWPAPFSAAEQAQLIIWRHRHIMDTENLQQEVEIPQRWLQAITDTLAAKMAAETPEVDANLIPILEQKAINSMRVAWDGDGDGSPTYIQPAISAYTA